MECIRQYYGVSEKIAIYGYGVMGSRKFSDRIRHFRKMGHRQEGTESQVINGTVGIS